VLHPKSGGIAHKAAPSPAMDPRYDNLIREMEVNGGQASFAVEQKSTTAQIGGAIKKATASVSSALTIKPRVTKAPDPLALDNMPRNIGIDMYYQAGRLAESNGNMAAAIHQYERGLREDPKHVPTLISLARIHDRQEEFLKAEKLYRRALDVEPENAMAHNDLGLCLARHGRTDDAVAGLRKAVELEPDRKLYRNNLATVLVDAGRADEAWKELIAVHPAGAAHYNLGFLLYHAGQRDRAREELVAAQREDATLLAAREMIQQLDRESTPGAAATLAQKPATKVQVRIDDLAPQPPTSLGRTAAQPVSLRVAPSELRRTPPTSPPTGNAAAPTSDPAEPDADPLLLYPVEGESELGAPSDVPCVAPPTTALPPRKVTVTLADTHDDAELPTPDALLRPRDTAPRMD
jgi:Flp pilus assembly protein TadD